MNATERGIREQFALWRQAPDPGRLPLGPAYAVLGCGTSVHVADSVAAALSRAGHVARAVPANEWLRRRADYLPETLPVSVLALSRSGESSETVAAARQARAEGLPVTALTCAEGSAICAAGDRVLYARTHDEEGIVMTASASLMLLMGLRLAGIAVEDATVAAAEALLDTASAPLAALAEGRSHFVMLGGGGGYGVMREAALKLQEMSLAQVEAHHPLEYRHGPVSLVDERTLVVLLYHPDTLAEESLLAGELMAKGARVAGLGGPGTVSFPLDVPAALRGLVCLPAMQMLGESVARLNGCDTLAPRHLTKVVTTPVIG